MFDPSTCRTYSDRQQPKDLPPSATSVLHLSALESGLSAPGCRATIKVRTPDNQDEKDVPPLAAQGGRSPTGGASGGKFA